MDSVRANSPSGLLPRVSLAWQAARRGLACALRGDVLSKDKYAVFISYRHAEPDRHWADWLHSALESFVIPHGVRNKPDQRRIGRVFRDEVELAASPHLSADIKDALDRSDWLVVVCSPRSVNSEWISAEILHFRELQRGDRILALLIEGEPAESFPEALHEIRPSLGGDGAFDHDEPLAADVRPNSRTNSRTLRRWAKLRLLATILGHRFDELRRREQERQFRRLALLTTSAVVGLVVVGLLAITAFWEKTIADQKTVEAITQKDLADSAAKKALRNQSVALTALANIEESKRPVNAAKLAVAAWPRDRNDPTPKLKETIDLLGQVVPDLRERRLFKDAGLFAAFSPDGSRIVTASKDNTARVWDAATGETIAVLSGHEAAIVRLLPDFVKAMKPDRTTSVTSAAFSPDGSRIVTASNDETARVWDAATGKAIATLRGHEDWVISAAFSPDGSRIVTASEDKTARVWDAVKGTTIAVLAGHGKRIRSAAFSPDGARIVTAAEDNTARVWDAASGKSILVLSGHEPATGILASIENSVNSAAFSPDGARIVTASDDKTARVWDAVTGKAVAVLSGHAARLSYAAFSPDGSRIVTTSWDNTARVWDSASSRAIAVLRHEDGVTSAAFSPDGSRIVTTSHDNTARVWDATTGNVVTTLRGHEEWLNSPAFSPDGSRVLTASGDRTTRIWDVATGHSIAVLAGHGKSVDFAAFSPDGSRIVTASRDSTARVWDSASGKAIAVLKGHDLWVHSAAFSPDGSRIVTASDDETARIWDAESGTTIAILSPHDP
jgi:WD40 repeat protein